MADRVKSAMGGKKSSKKSKGKSKGKHVHEMHIRHAKNGGFIVKHDLKGQAGEMPPEPEEHAIPDLSALQAHVGDNMATPPPEAAPAPMSPQMPLRGGM